MSSVFGAGSGPDEQKISTSVDEVLIKKEVSIIPSGIPGFDESLGQGLPAGNLYLVSGTLGSSSVQLVQEILYNTLIAKGKVTYYTVEDSSTDIIQDMKVHGMNISQFVDEGSWRFGRVIPPNMKKVLEALPEVPMEQRIFLDESFTDLMNHYYDTIKDGFNTVIHLPVLVRNYSLDDIQNLLFYMKGNSFYALNGRSTR